MSGEESAPQMAPVESPHVVFSVKLPILKKGEYTLWSMRMEQYLTNTDYALWQVIMNGDEPVQTIKDENDVETKVPPKATQALLQRQRERKAKFILLLAIPDEYQLRFHGIKDAKTLWAAIKSRFGGNIESKKMQKNILKQQFENFSISDTEGLDKAYDRFQKLISLLEVHGAAVSNEDANQKFLRALPSSWNNVALIMRNKTGIDDLDIDDLYNNLKVFEADIKGSSGSSSSSHNLAFSLQKTLAAVMMLILLIVFLQQALKYKGMFDSGCSRHMTGNKALLTDYHDIDGGFVAFGGSTRGGKITGIGKIRTNKIDFEDVFFVKELKFNLFSVSQMCDKLQGKDLHFSRYSVHSKAFRVFNTETRKVEENLHVNFLENKPNVAGKGPNWLFYIDSLTNSMNYQPVTIGNQTNKNACPQETNGNTGLKKNVDAGQTEEENVSTQQYIVFPLWSSISSNYKNQQEKITRASSTNSFNTVSITVNTASASRTFSPIGPSSGPSFVPFGGSFPIDVANLPHDPLMPELEDTAEIRSNGIFGNAYNDHDLETLNTPYVGQSVGAEADFNNMEPSIVINPIPITRVHSTYPKAQIIRDPKSAVQTRGMTKKNSEEHAMISYI
ncbi:hypothetical protein Tco_0085576 [Tanacetum coccineum]